MKKTYHADQLSINYVEITGHDTLGVSLVVADAERFSMTAYRYEYAFHRFTAEFSNPTDALHFVDYVSENYTFSSLGIYHRGLR